MQNQTKTPLKAQPKATNTNQAATVHHPARTIFASLFGILAVLLILSSLITVWLNRTLTDTKTYVSVVAPLATDPAIQNFVAQNVTEQLVKNAPPQDLANVLLPGNQVAGQNAEQLKILLRPTIYKSVLQVVQSPSFAQLWKNTNQTAHSQLISQLSSNSSTLDLNLNPVLVNVVNELKTTQLAPVAQEINIDSNAGKISLKDSGIDQARQNYRRFKEGTVAMVIVTLVLIAASIAISTHHLKTTRRILVGTAIFCLFIVTAIQLPAIISIKGSDMVTQKAAIAIEQTLFHNLQVAALCLGLGAIAIAVATKLFDIFRAKKA